VPKPFPSPNNLFNNKLKFSSMHTKRGITELRAGGSLNIPGCAPLNAFFVTYPYAAAFIICAFKASAADLVAQASTSQTAVAKLETRGGGATKNREKFFSFNMKRNLAFICYGGFYQGCCQEYIYNGLFTNLFGAGSAFKNVAMKVSCDCLLVCPLVGLPIAYLIKAAVFRYSIGEAFSRYVTDIKENQLLKRCWSIWAPAQCVSFAFVPTHLRISFMACVSFFWIIMLSSISSEKS